MPSPLHSNPFDWFDAWYLQALDAISPDPNAMTLATVDSRGCPSTRVVLLKSWDANGFVFHTNRRSRKGTELQANPHAALSFYWREFGRQIRIEGTTALLDDDASDAYFASRARDAQIGAWASLQSSELGSWDELETRVKELTAEFEGKPVPRPPHWGGTRVVPNRFEFWMAGQARIHERWQFDLSPDGDWAFRLLYP